MADTLCRRAGRHGPMEDRPLCPARAPAAPHTHSYTPTAPSLFVPGSFLVPIGRRISKSSFVTLLQETGKSTDRGEKQGLPVPRLPGHWPGSAGHRAKLTEWCIIGEGTVRCWLNIFDKQS